MQAALQWLRFTFGQPLYLLITAQTVFLLLGVFALDFSITWQDIAASLATAVITELICSNLERTLRKQQRRWFFPASALAAGLGITLFFRALSPWYFSLAAFLAIASKYAIRIESKHIFNPSNFGIVVSVFAFASATTIEFTQWGNSPYLFAAIALTCYVIAYRAGVFVTTASFLLSYTAGLLVLAPLQPTVFSIHHYGLLGPSIALFASFMITDPKTAPTGTLARIFHGVSVAMLFFILESLGIRYSLFVASFLIAGANAAMRLVNIAALPVLRRLPTNGATFALCLALFAWVTFVAFNSIQSVPNFLRTPARYVLLGVESPSFRSCGPAPVFTPLQHSGLEYSSGTHGAAWGDYDNDGYDDLFVSNMFGTSTLYRNTGSGTFVPVRAGLPTGLTSSGAFFIDYDNDGWLDLFLPGSPRAATGVATRFGSSESVNEAHLYRNIHGTFEDASVTAGLHALPALGSGTITFADYNNDGWLDIMLAQPGSTLTVTSQRNRALQKAVMDPRFPRLGRFICYRDNVSALMPQVLSLAGDTSNGIDARDFIERGGCIAATYDIGIVAGKNLGIQELLTKPLSSATLVVPGSARLLENREGRFVEHSEFAALVRDTLRPQGINAVTTGNKTDYASGTYWQPISFDYDGDGLQDIFLSIDSGSSILLRNDGAFAFHDATIESGVNYYGTGMGTDVADYDGDGRLDLFVDNVWSDYLYRNSVGGFVNTFQTQEIGKLGIGWGTAFLDYNLDGWEDLYVANGDMSETIGTSLDAINRPVFRSDNLYRNDRQGHLSDVTGIDLCPDSRSSRALAVSDYDNNGTPDVFVGNYAAGMHGPGAALLPQENVLLRNTTTGAHYLEIALEGVRSNRMGVGALVSVRSGSHTQMKPMLGTSGFYSQNSRRLIFGLGTSTNAVDVRVEWPSGIVQAISDVSVDQLLTIRESR